MINFNNEFARVSFIDELNSALGIDFLSLNKIELLKVAKKSNIPMDDNMSHGKIVDKLFGELVEPKLLDPTFVLDYPKLISPLAKKKRGSDIWDFSRKAHNGNYVTEAIFSNIDFYGGE